MVATNFRRADAKEPTLFSQARFVDAIAKTMGPSVTPIELHCASPMSTVCGVERVYSLGLRRIALAPFGLYAHPSGSDVESLAAVKDFIRQMKMRPCLMFEWNVRFDHEPLAQELSRLGIPFARSATHALSLSGSYEATFARFDSTTRNLVRRTCREGLVVRSTRKPEEVTAYYEIHKRLALEKGNYRSIYPKSLFDELLKLEDDVVFAVAQVGERIAAGAWFFRDGDTLMYWHAATDRKYSRHSPSYAILDYAIRMAHAEGRRVFNFGGSAGIGSVEQFKSKWGAEPQSCWCFSWQSPVWRSLRFVKQRLWRQHG